MDKKTLVERLEQEVKGLTAKLVAQDYLNAVDKAERDTGWTMPVTASFKVGWMIERAKRHLLAFLSTEATMKFKFKQVNLQHRFDNLERIITRMDKEFEEALAANPADFASVDALQMFGTKIDAGFATEAQTGRDLTYDEDYDVVFEPGADA